MLKEACEIARNLCDKASQIRAVAAFEPEQAHQLSTQALAEALATEQDDRRAISLCNLLPYLMGMQRLETFKAMLRSCLGIQTVHTIGSTVTRRRIERGFLLERIADVVGTLADIGGPNCPAAVASAINDTAMWWP